MTQILNDFSATNLLNAIQSNAYAFFTRRERLLGKAISEEGWLTWIEGSTPPVVAWLHEPLTEESAHTRARQVATRFALRGLNEAYVAVVETGDCLPAWKSCGAVGIETEMVMVAPLSGFIGKHPWVRGLSIDRISDDAGLRDCVEVISAGRDQWIAGFFQLTNPSLSQGNEFLRYYLARFGERPVATAAQFFFGELCGIWWVTTVPEMRSRGVGTSITRVAMADAANLGYRAVMIETMPDMAHRYRRLGFRESCNINVYRWRRPCERFV